MLDSDGIGQDNMDNEATESDRKEVDLRDEENSADDKGGTPPYIFGLPKDLPVTKFRDNQGRRFIRALFYEWNTKNPLYTLREDDYKGYPSLKKLYLAAEDLTEYKFASLYFENYEHWLLLCESNWFKEYLNRWRTELELKLKSEAVTYIVEISRADTKNSYEAAKWIANKGWIDKTAEPTRRGRPSKADIARAAAEAAFDQTKLSEIAKRMETN